MLRRVIVFAVVVALLVVGGCASSSETSAPAQSAESGEYPAPELSAADIEAQVRTAAVFTLAMYFGDAGLLSTLIDPADASAFAEEIATIEGTSIDPNQVSVREDDSGYVAFYGDLAVGILPHPNLNPMDIDSHTIAREDFCSFSLTCTESSSGWIVDTVQGRPAVVEILRSTVTGQDCLENLYEITIAAKAYRAHTDDFVLPATFEDLVPDYLDEVPTCPCGGEYALDEDGEASCSRHGEW